MLHWYISSVTLINEIFFPFSCLRLETALNKMTQHSCRVAHPHTFHQIKILHHTKKMGSKTSTTHSKLKLSLLMTTDMTPDVCQGKRTTLLVLYGMLVENVRGHSWRKRGNKEKAERDQHQSLFVVVIVCVKTINSPTSGAVTIHTHTPWMTFPG